MMPQSFYFITGVFFQEGQVLGIGHDEKIGSRVKVNSAIPHTFFSGLIDTSEDAGVLQDAYGKSGLFVYNITETSFEFTKRYEANHDHDFFYKFHKLKDGGFIGHWQGKDKNIWGTARCFIRGVNRNEFFDHHKSFELMEPFLVDGKFENLIKTRPVVDPVEGGTHESFSGGDSKDDLPF